jgi:hypothetical protein
MTKPLLPQQRYSLFVTKPGRTGERLEITNDVDQVTLEIDQDRISVLTFVLNCPEKHSEYMDVGYHIDFYGGYVDHDNFADKMQASTRTNFTYDTKTSDQYRYAFNGRVFWVKMIYNKSSEQMRIICKDMSWGATAINLPHFTYPSTNSARSFANVTTIKLSEIVKGIADDIQIKCEIQISQDVEFTFKRAAVQRGITDWAFLRQLAKNSACYVWTNIDPDTGEYTLYFIDRDKAVNKQNARTEFVWLGRKDNYEFKEGAYLPTGNGQTEISRFRPNQIQINEIEVDVNPMIAGSNVTQVTDFDEKTGQEVTKLVSYEEDSESIFYWELDTEKVERLVRENPTEANRIQNMGAFGIPPETFKEYYIKRPIPKGIINCIDRPFHGINVSAKIDGDINIEPFQSYPIHGIGKWSTRKSHKSLNYYLYSIVHNWGGGQTFETELKFKA